MAWTSALSVFKTSNFALAFYLLPKKSRLALQAVYAFCRAVDDAVDQAVEKAVRHQPVSGADAPPLEYEDARQTLSAWRFFLNSLDDPVPAPCPQPPIGQALRDARRSFSINLKHLLDLTDGVERDLDQNRYETFDQLKGYCYGVASTVGLACLPLFGLNEDRHAEFAVNLGIAVQLTNILRDVRRDAAVDHIYLPREDLRRFGYGEDELRKSVYNENFICLMEFESTRASEFYNKALACLPPADRRAARPALLMAHLYRTLLRRVRRKKYDVFSSRIRLSVTDKLFSLISVFG